MKRTLASLTAVLLSTSSLYSAALLPNGQQQFVDGNGNPYASGTVTFYSNYPTCSVLKNTWSNSGQTVLNTNPVVLDSAGRATIFGSGSYCQVLKDSSGNTIWTKETSDPSGTSNLGWGGTSGGTANAQTVTVSGFSSTNGQTFYFVAGYTNTSSMTISVNGGAALSVLKDTPTGSQFLTGGEVVAGNVTGVTYVSSTGTLHLITNTTTTPSGQVSGFAMNSCPGGWVEADGSAISRTTYANLYSNIGTTWGAGNGSTTFNLPDFRAQFLRGWDHGAGVDKTLMSGVLTSGSSTVTGLSSTASFYVGMPISGTGIPSGATVGTIPSTTSITLADSSGNPINATASSIPTTTQTGTLPATTSATITGLTSTSGLVVGQSVSATGIPAGSTIQIINSGTSITISALFTSTGSQTITFGAVTTPITFTGRKFGSYQADAYLNHSHPVTDVGHNHTPGSYSAGGGGSTGNGVSNQPVSTSPTGLLVNNSTTGGVETRPKNGAVLFCVKY